jgi:hypothetical protein
MRPLRCLIPALLIGASAVLASSCASKERVTPIFPSHADLRVEAKPRLDPEAIESDAALTAHDDAVEAWGERGWAAIGRICRWAVENGAALSFRCPPPAAPPRPG